MTTEEWALMTPDEVRAVKKMVRCRKCKYHGVFSGGEVFCDYLGMTRKRRGCTVDECKRGGIQGEPPKHKVQPHALTKEMKRRPYRSIVDREVKADEPDFDKNKGVSEWMIEGVKKTGIDLKALARELGVSSTTIYNWRDGLCRPSEINLQKLAVTLKLDINDSRVRTQ